MFRTIRTVVSLLVMAVAAGLLGTAIEQYRTDYILNDVVAARAQDARSEALLGIAKVSVGLNKTFLERESKAAQIVAGIREENTRLKASLKEAVETIKQLTDEANNNLDEIERLQFKVATLQAALDAIKANGTVIVPDVPAPSPPAPPAPTNP